MHLAGVSVRRGRYDERKPASIILQEPRRFDVAGGLTGLFKDDAEQTLLIETPHIRPTGSASQTRET